MNERSTFDILLDYPKQNGLPFETHQDNRRFYLFPEDPILRSKYVIFKKDSLFFCAFDSFAAKAYMSKTFSGVYKSVNLPVKNECKIYKKDWLDTFLRYNKVKTEAKYVDDFLTITSKSNWIPKEGLSKENVSLFGKICEKISPLTFLIQNDFLPMIKDLRGKNVVGLETNQWIYTGADLDILINEGGRLIDNIINASAQQHV
jgi:hypothetical protein